MEEGNLNTDLIYPQARTFLIYFITPRKVCSLCSKGIRFNCDFKRVF